MTNFGLSKDNFDFIIGAIGHYPDIREARIFGSRALGNYKDTSDIDIALMGNLKDFTAGSVREFLNTATPFLYKVDVIEYDKISNTELKKHIDQFGKVIYNKQINW